MPTLLELRTAVRRKIDRVNAATPSDAELTEWINESAAELWDLLVTTYEDQFTTFGVTESIASPITATTGALFRVLVGSAPIFKLRSIECSANGSWIEIPAVPKQEWWKYANTLGTTVPAGYTLVGTQIHILPETTGAQSYRVFYIPTYTALSADTDSLFDVPNRWDEYVVVDACIKARAKFQEDASLEMARKAELRLRITRAASNRTPGMSKKVVQRATHRSRN